MFVNGKTLVRTRFAPSPTGYLHIGGVRTALFNYLYAKRYDGSFILRIDDTDKGRNIQAAIKPIMDGLQWLKINWDDGPIFQSGRIEHYEEIAKDMIKKGLAYPDPSGPSEDDVNPYRGNNRNLYPDRCMELWDDTGWAIRFKMPDDEIIVDDLIRGPVRWNCKRIGDPIILRNTGVATYNFATAIDDIEMKISHVIRGEEHLSNTAIQVAIQHALNYVPPFFAHVPFVCEPGSKKKLSKRDTLKFITPEIIDKLRELGFSQSEILAREELNPAILSYYQVLGYKPSGIANYLARLGWSLDDETEIMSMEDLVKNFSLERVGKSPSQFDPKKLLWVNSHHTNLDSLDVKTHECSRILSEAKLLNTPATQQDFYRVKDVVKVCGERIKCYSDILSQGGFFFKKPQYNQNDVDKYLTTDMMRSLDILTQMFKLLPEWSHNALEKCMRDYMEEHKLNKELIFAVRVALCGHNIGPSLFDTMELMGKEECLSRIYAALELR